MLRRASHGRVGEVARRTRSLLRQGCDRRCRGRDGAQRSVRPPHARETDAGGDRRREGGDRIERQGGRCGRFARRAPRPQDDSWSFSHFDTITVSVADAPRADEILVVMAIADGGRLRNRCGTEPIR